jgi:hypothetical protein
MFLPGTFLSKPLSSENDTGIILKDLARSATLVARVHIRPAPDPSQAQDDGISRWEDKNDCTTLASS